MMLLPYFATVECNWHSDFGRLFRNSSADVIGNLSEDFIEGIGIFCPFVEAVVGSHAAGGYCDVCQ